MTEWSQISMPLLVHINATEFESVKRMSERDKYIIAVPDMFNKAMINAETIDAEYTEREVEDVHNS